MSKSLTLKKSRSSLLRFIEKKGIWFYLKKEKVEGIRVPKKYAFYAKLLFKLAKLGGKNNEEIENLIYGNLKSEMKKKRILKLQNRYSHLIKISEIDATCCELDRLIKLNKIKSNAEILRILIESKEFKMEKQVTKMVEKKLKGEDEESEIISRLKVMSLKYPEIAIRLMKFRKVSIDTSMKFAEAFELKHMPKPLSGAIRLEMIYVNYLLNETEPVIRYLSRKMENIDIEDIKANLKKRLVRKRKHLRNKRISLLDKKKEIEDEIYKLNKELISIKMQLHKISEESRKNSWVYHLYNAIFGIFDSVIVYMIYNTQKVREGKDVHKEQEKV